MKLHQIFGVSQIFGGQNEISPNIWHFPNIWHSHKQQVKMRQTHPHVPKISLRMKLHQIFDVSQIFGISQIFGTLTNNA